MSNDSAQAVLDARQLKHAKKGILAGVLSGVLWGASGTILYLALNYAPFTNPQYASTTDEFNLPYVAIIVAMSLCGALMHDTFAAIWVFINNVRAGKFKEYGRTLRTKPGKMVCLGAILGGPIGMSGYLLGITFVSSAYALPITAAYPALAAVLATFIFRERNPARVWIGVVLCIVGSFLVYYAPMGEGQEKDVYFAIGMILSTLACVGWASEGLLSTYGMDMLDPDIALGIREAVSAIAYFIFVLPIVTLYMSKFGPTPIWEMFVGATRSSALPIYAFAGFLGGFSYIYWYRALNMTGVARAMALNVTYALWGVLFGALFTPLDPTRYLYMGAGSIAIGAILVSANPRELFKLRETK
ncbi:MAG: DMT family transporter [Deltaproteobacteria bacterium]|jgi:drug/metabolite transporter (DMT)-like permease|nr:DMT family transporter [Deltaproteobacteria bacterium]